MTETGALVSVISVFAFGACFEFRTSDFEFDLQDGPPWRDDFFPMGDRADDAADVDRDDPMAPPKEPCECYCLHCQRVFMSDQMWFQRVVGDKQGFKGFWMCPTPNCSGAGFCFDIFPTDPDHPANAGWVDFDDEDVEEFDEDELTNDPDVPWDPQETKYKELDEAGAACEADEDIEGEEWKYGLQPGDEPPEPPWAAEARREWEQEQRQYDEPDRRPRELDWSNREDRETPPWGEEDIPF
jgi:hypothetical protein